MSFPSTSQKSFSPFRTVKFILAVLLIIVIVVTAQEQSPCKSSTCAIEKREGIFDSVTKRGDGYLIFTLTKRDNRFDGIIKRDGFDGLTKRGNRFGITKRGNRFGITKRGDGYLVFTLTKRDNRRDRFGGRTKRGSNRLGDIAKRDRFGGLTN